MYSIDGTDIVINGWENGISDNPYNGLNDMRGVNIISIPGEASVSFAQTNDLLPSCAATIASSSAADDTVTVTGVTGTLHNGQAVVFTGASLPGGITAGVVYWLAFLNGNTFKLFTAYNYTTIINISSDVAGGTMASVDMKDVTYFEKTVGAALDSAGRAWKFNGTHWIYLGNPVAGTVGLAATIGNGIVWYKGYLFVMYNSRICYVNYPASGDPTTQTWVNEWDPFTGAANAGTQVFWTVTGISYQHDAIVGQDDVVYIADGAYIDSFFEKAGQTFNPANTATYTWNGYTNSAGYALKLPSYEIATCLEELGVNLMVGGSYNYIYPWDRTSTSFKYPMKIADNYTSHLLTVNTNMYIFAGRRGRIYVTNGTQANLYAKIPDHISGIEPVFEWKNCCYNKNQIYFGISATDNSLNAITTYAGLWAIDITTNALRCPTLQSNILGTVTAVYAYNSAVSGYGLAVAWKYGALNGVDSSNSTNYSTYIPYIETDLIPVGQFLKKRTFKNLEFKLTKPMANGDGIKISARDVKDGTYVQIGETLGTTTVTPMSDYYLVNFDQSQWLQFKIELKGTLRLIELRLR